MKPGDDVAGYKLQTLLGSGAFGEVWLASQGDLKRQVALKLMKGDAFGAKAEVHEKRFRREMQIQASLVHPNLVGVFDGGIHQGELYLAMEFVKGATLRRVLAESGAFREPKAMALMAAIAGATAYLHEKEVIHRDLKPDNVLIDETGSPRITDFGLSRATGNTILTKTNQLVGTPNYFAPELMEGQDNTGASDVYALGVIAYEVVSGKIPYRARSFAGLAREILTGTRIPLTQLVPDVTPAVDALIERCLSLEPKVRPTAAELEQGFRGLIDVTKAARRPSGARSGAMRVQSSRMVIVPVPAPPSRKPVALVVGGVALGLAVVGGYFLVRQPPQAVTLASPSPGSSAVADPPAATSSRSTIVVEKYCEQLRGNTPLVYMVPPGPVSKLRETFLRYTAGQFLPGKELDQAHIGLFVMIPRESKIPARLSVTSGSPDPAMKLRLNGKELTAREGSWSLDPRTFRAGVNVLELDGAGAGASSLRLGLSDLGEIACVATHRPYPAPPPEVLARFQAIEAATGGVRYVTGMRDVLDLVEKGGSHGQLLEFVANCRMMIARGRLHLTRAGGVRVMADVLSGSEARIESSEPDELTLARGVESIQRNLSAWPTTSSAWLLLSRLINLGGLHAEALLCARYACILQPDFHHAWTGQYRVLDDAIPLMPLSREDLRQGIESMGIARELDGSNTLYPRAIARLEELFAGGGRGKKP